MTAKEYLSQVRVLDKQNKALELELEALREEAGNLKSMWPDGQPHGTGTTDPVATEAVKLAEQADKLEIEYRRRLFEIRKKRFEILTLLENVDDAECHDLLCQRYVRCLRWEQIAVNMEKSYQWVAGPLHSKALQLVARLLSE